MADNTMIIVAVIAVLVCICSSISGGVAFYMNQETAETAETAGKSPPPPAGSPPPPAGSPPPPAGSPPPPAGSGVTCKADGTWSNNSPVPPGTVITKACPSGGTQTAKCKADGDWESDWQCSGASPKETPWNNCAVWDETTPGKHDDWCRNDFGSHAKHVGQGQHGCAKGWGKGVCKH